ncbi:uncharacterized protein EV420DRAFT_310675 [Desarmillaria tabescens]|uniref:Uncharacterized protein n=1 Tax=Armillaria tabescens TaxID=1929756 RepID=A0AA39KEC9_ARMTA|nr:uncharacterized protein EV420DRAFT_310675 [Desarmillaria tabescens]KAK0459248.1 hypothetical protein EV420DRAFT_310675 [Desarmillaria tabescens]
MKEKMVQESLNSSKKGPSVCIFHRMKTKLSCPPKKRQMSAKTAPLQNDLTANESRPTQLTAAETQKFICDEYSSHFNKEPPAFLQRSLFVIFHFLLATRTDAFDPDDYAEDFEMMSTFYGLDWKDVCDYLGLDRDKGDEQFRKKCLTRINLPELVQGEMHDTIRRGVRTSVRRRIHHHVMPVVTESLSSFGGLLYTHISHKLCLDGTTSGGFTEIAILHQYKMFLIFIILKQRFFLGHPSRELLAQVVAEMRTIFVLNKKLSGLEFPVYAIVSDLSHFFYYCYAGDEFISRGTFELAAKVGFDFETASNLTTTFMLTSFAPDFFSIIARGILLLFRSYNRPLTTFGRPRVRYKASAQVTSSYQDDIIEKFRRTVLGAKKKKITECQKAVGIAHTILCYIGLTWIPEDGLARGERLDLASIKGLVPPGITMRYKVDRSDAIVRLRTLELRPNTGECAFMMDCEESQAYHIFDLDSLTSCFDVGTKTLISGILEMVQKCLPNVPVCGFI